MAQIIFTWIQSLYETGGQSINFLFSITSPLDLGPTYFPVQWVLGFFPGGRVANCWQLTHLHMQPRLRMCGTVPLLPFYTFMAWAETTLWLLNGRIVMIVYIFYCIETVSDIIVAMDMCFNYSLNYALFLLFLIVNNGVCTVYWGWNRSIVQSF